jgi:hypothetical protein
MGRCGLAAVRGLFAQNFFAVCFFINDFFNTIEVVLHTTNWPQLSTICMPIRLTHNPLGIAWVTSVTPWSYREWRRGVRASSELTFPRPPSYQISQSLTFSCSKQKPRLCSLRSRTRSREPCDPTDERPSSRVVGKYNQSEFREAAGKNLIWIRCNPLKSPDSDE